jgi:hypothetical protein
LDDSPNPGIFHIVAAARDAVGQDHIRRVLLADGGEARTFLAVIQAKNAAQGREKASRADLRFGVGAGGEIYLLNKGDGVVREVVPARP